MTLKRSISIRFQQTFNLNLAVQNHHQLASYSCSTFIAGKPSSTSSNRKPRSLNHLKNNKLQTTRSKIRKVIDQNLIEKRFFFLDHDVDFYLQRAQNRLAFAQAKLYQIWNPDYKGIDINTATVDLKLLSKPKTIMDDRWWFWNILLALLPSIIIALYCELLVKPEMKEESYQRDLMQLESFGDPEFKENYIKYVLEPQRSQQKSLWTIVQDSSLRLMDECTMLINIMNESNTSQNVEHIEKTSSNEAKASNHINNADDMKANVNSDSTKNETGSSTSSSPMSSTNDKKTSPAAIGVQSLEESSSNTNVNEIQILQHRIEKLEKIIFSQQTMLQQDDVEKNNPTSQYHPGTSSSSSGIKQRVEKNLIAQYEQNLKDAMMKSERKVNVNLDEITISETLSKYFYDTIHSAWNTFSSYINENHNVSEDVIHGQEQNQNRIDDKQKSNDPVNLDSTAPKPTVQLPTMEVRENEKKPTDITSNTTVESTTTTTKESNLLESKAWYRKFW